MRDNFGNYIGNIGDNNHISMGSNITKIRELTNINDLAEEYVFAVMRLKEERRYRFLKYGIVFLISLLIIIGLCVYLWLNRIPNFSLQNLGNYMSDMLKQFWPALLANLVPIFIGAYAVGGLTNTPAIENDLREARNAAKDRAKIITPKKKWRSSWKQACHIAREKYSNTEHDES